MKGTFMRVAYQERLPNETRVAATLRKLIEQLLKLGFSVAIEAGRVSWQDFDDKAFAQAGADIVDGNAIWQSEIILRLMRYEEGNQHR